MSASQATTIPLQKYLMRLYWLGVLPLLLLATGLAAHNVRSIRASQDEQAFQLASSFMATVDQHLGSTTKALQAIAQSSHLNKPDEWEQLYEEATSLRSAMGIEVGIIDAAPPHQMRLNTLVPFGSPLPTIPARGGRQSMPAALASLAPTVGDRLASAINQSPTVVVAVPALREGRAVYALVSPIPTARFQNMIEGHELPDGWCLTLRDGLGQTLAQTGTPIPGSDVHDETLRIEVPSQRSTWHADLEIPRSERLAPLLTTGGSLVLLLAVAALVGALGSRAGSRRLGLAVASLTRERADSGQVDIEEIQRAKTVLEEAAQRERLSEARFRRLFKDAPIALRLTDAQGNTVAQNAHFEELFGYTLEDAPTLDTWREKAFQDPVERQRLEQNWDAVIAGAKSGVRQMMTGEFNITAKDGTRRVVHVQGSLLDHGLMSSFVDLTEQRANEASLRLWAEAFELAELCLSISDTRTKTFRSVNPAFAKMHGYEREDMQGMAVATVIPQDGLADWKDQTKHFDSLGHAVIEREHLHKDGSRFPVQLDMTVLHDAQGAPVSRLVYATDLTERHRIEGEIRQLQETLERRVIQRTALLSQANQELDSFAYTVSHDLRSPLRAMDGFLHLLREEHGECLPLEAQAYLDKISAAIRRMKNLIEGILTLTHSARHDLQLAPVNLSDLVAKHLNELAAADPDRRAHIEVEPGIEVVGDERMLDVVVSNLVGNAWKYTSKTAEPRIRFYATQEGGTTWFCLGDNGAGFEAASAEKLFQPFQRMHRHEEFPGIGIGLATVQRIVLRHGGQIHAQASPGQGATFRFYLNATRAQQDNTD